MAPLVESKFFHQMSLGVERTETFMLENSNFQVNTRTKLKEQLFNETQFPSNMSQAAPFIILLIVCLCHKDP